MLVFFNKIACFLLTIVVCLSTMSFTINKHYCSNILIDKAIFKPAITCGMHHDKSQHKKEQKSCCESETQIISGQTDLKYTCIDYEINPPLAIGIFLYVYSHTSTLFYTPNFVFQEDDPPNINTNILALYQVYII